jgi:hypothetical protein
MMVVVVMVVVVVVVVNFKSSLLARKLSSKWVV